MTTGALSTAGMVALPTSLKREEQGEGDVGTETSGAGTGERRKVETKG